MSKAPLETAAIMQHNKGPRRAFLLTMVGPIRASVNAPHGERPAHSPQPQATQANTPECPAKSRAARPEVAGWDERSESHARQQSAKWSNHPTQRTMS